MGQNIAHKIIGQHLVEGEMVPEKEVAISIDQTLTQDATGTMTYLQFEALGFQRVKAKLSVSYVDHNMLQTGFENADDHIFLQTMAAKYGVHYSRPGNGISHQVHLERFGAPGHTLLGADSHTCMAGALGMIAIGTGGLEVAVGMAGAPFHFTMPHILLVRLRGRLKPWVAAKDIILEVLRRISVKGGVGRILEFGGEGVATLSVPQRATIANLGAETGATTTVFPSDLRTRAWLAAQGRREAWQPLRADRDAIYHDVLDIDLSSLEPLIACPSSPDNIVPVRDVEGTPVAQVCVGSSNNSSYEDLMAVANILKGRGVHPKTSLTISPGSRQVMATVTRSSGLWHLVQGGARILEVACGPCIGMGQAPPSGAVSVRTFNRNFPGRSGTSDDRVYLASPEVAGATALYGVITDPRRLGSPTLIRPPRQYVIDDSQVLPPSPEPERIEVIRGPNIKPLPRAHPLADHIRSQVILKVGHNVTTDHIMPAGNRVLPLRSNIPAIAEHVFEPIDPTFPRRCREAGGGLIVGGHNYGQGSSREHAALAPMYLGIKAVLALSFARIHFANLINFGIVPLIFVQEEDYQWVEQGDEIELENLRSLLPASRHLRARNLSQGRELELQHALFPRQVNIILAGGLLNYVRGAGHESGG
ncbi:MAG: aconitate hydratase [Chloroflexi bacterium]|nr:aconitate hydratase [Chloroflexota bacterium]